MVLGRQSQRDHSQVAGIPGSEALAEAVRLLTTEVTDLRKRLDDRERSPGSDRVDQYASQGPPESIADEGDELEVYASDSMEDEESSTVGGDADAGTPTQEQIGPSASSQLHPSTEAPTSEPSSATAPTEGQSSEGAAAQTPTDALTEGNLEKVLTVVNAFFGLSTPQAEESPAEKWVSIGDPGEGGAPALPKTRTYIHVDGSFPAAVQSVSGRRWSAYPLDVNRLLRVSDQHYAAIIQCPPVPQAAWERLALRKAATIATTQVAGQTRFELSNKSLSAELEHLAGFDRTARFGMKVSALQLLITEWMVACPLEDRGEETFLLMARVLTALSRAHVAQYARVINKATVLRRQHIIPALGLPAIAAKSLQDAPIQGPDLFGGSFERIVDEEVSRQETFLKTKSVTPSAQPFRGGAPGFRGGKGTTRGASTSGSSRKRRGTARGGKTQRSQPTTFHRPPARLLRGASRGRSPRGRRGSRGK